MSRMSEIVDEILVDTRAIQKNGAPLLFDPRHKGLFDELPELGSIELSRPDLMVRYPYQFAGTARPS